VIPTAAYEARGDAPVAWHDRSGAWIGIGTGPAVLMVGAGLARTTGVTTAAIGIALGAVTLYLVAVAHGSLGQRHGLAMGANLQEVLGRGAGPVALTLALVAAMIGWCGFYLGLGGAALADLLEAPQWLGSLLLGGVVLGAALSGQDLWNRLVYLTAASSVALTLITVLTVPVSHQPSDIGVDLQGLATAMGGAIVYAIVFAMRAPDFTADLGHARDVWKVGLTMLVPYVVLAGLGIWLYRRTGLHNMADVLAGTERPEAGQAFLMLSAVGPAITAVYSCAVSIDSIRRARHVVTMSLVGLVAIVLGAGRFDRSLIGFLEAIAVVIPPALVVVLTVPILKNRPKPSHATLAWLAGSLVALAVRDAISLAAFLAGAVVAFGWLLLAPRSERPHQT
jgi:cytosine permease